MVRHRQALRSRWFAGALLAVGAPWAVPSIASEAPTSQRSAQVDAQVDAKSAERAIAQWPEQPRLGAAQTLAKYGAPQEMTDARMTWRDAGPFRRITVHRDVVPHDFPLPHVDFLEHTVSYQVPADKLGDVLRFDGSITIDRTAGEVSARCDTEAHNVLALNLSRDIITGKKSVSEAREAFAASIRQEVLGKPTMYLGSLQFKPDPPRQARFSDTPAMKGAPVRATDQDANARRKRGANGDDREKAEAIAQVMAIDLNEIHAAKVAEKKQLRDEVSRFARTLHKDHGWNVVRGMQIGEQRGITPVNTDAVARIRGQGAGKLSTLVALDGRDFEEEFLDAMITGHRDALSHIDTLSAQVRGDAEFEQYLADTREHVAAHLRGAQDLQAMRQ